MYHHFRRLTQSHDAAAVDDGADDDAVAVVLILWMAFWGL